MPNAIAYLMLLIWPAVCLVMFRNMKVEQAIIWGIMGGYLFLPPMAEFDLPLVPSMDKDTIPAISVLMLLWLATKEKLSLWPESRMARVLVVLLVVCTIPTVLTNEDPIIFQILEGAGPIRFYVDALPGQSIRDIGSVFIGQILTLVPFLLARQFLSTADGLKELLIAFCTGVLIYSIPAMIEIRLSPQMNVWIYGFFQHSFEQMMRDGGFRPIVFLPHALWLALFVCIGLISATALARAAPKVDRKKGYLIMGYIFVLLILCKSLASIMYGLVLVPIVFFIPQRLQITCAVIFAVVALTYPMMRNLKLIPVDEIVAQIRTVNPERAHSLDYRFFNEEILLERAAEKPVFGWGGWGRSLERDSETGRIISIPDGRWIIIFGTFGWVGYLAEFGLLSLPLLLMGRLIYRNRRLELSPYIGPSTLILGITMMDMLLNATLTPLTWLTAGAILGHAERLTPNSRMAPRHALRLKPVIDTAPPKRRTVM